MRSAFVLLCFAFVFSGTAQMRRIYLDTLHDQNHINKISFYSSSQGYVGFNDWIGFTSDSGRSFSKKYITYYNVDYNGHFPSLGLGISGIKAFNQNTLIVYGDYGFVPSILYSSDGGNTFKLVYYSQENSTKLTDGVSDMVFPQGNTIGFAVDADRIIKTIDGGKNWSIIRFDPNSFFDHIEAIDNNTIFASSQYPSKLLKSSDGGSTWQQITLPADALRTVSFMSPTNGWVNAGEGGIFYTSNAGTTWTLKNNTAVAPIYVRYFKFLDDSTGYALGGEYSLFKTSDSGKIWEALPRDNNYTYLGYAHSDIFFWNKNQFWAGGNHGFLELTTNGGGAPLPAAYFRIDTTGLSLTNTVNLINLSKSNHQFKWYKNDVLISTSYNASYTHNAADSFDLIKLVAIDGRYSDTLLVGQYFNVPPPPPVPSITSFSPLVAAEGTIVSIVGTNFKGVSSVKFGGTNAISFTVISPNLIRAVVAKGTSGDITVTTTYGTATISGFQFTTLLTVTSIAPDQGPVGTIVTINGTQFNSTPSNNVVYFGAVRAQVLTSSSSQLTVIVPFGQSNRTITVTTSGSTAYAPTAFTLTFQNGDSISANSFPSKIDSTTDAGAYYLRSADFDNDGKPDVVISNFSYYYRVAVHRNTSSNDSISFQTPQYFNLGTGSSVAYNGIAIGDMNGDGKLDIIGQSNSDLAYLRNISTPGNINFAPAVILGNTHNYTPAFLDIIDFDGDGKPEPFGVAGTALGTFKNVSVGDSVAIATAGYYKLSESTYGFNSAAADLNGDRKPDIVFSAIYNHNWSLYAFRNTSNGGIVSFDSTILPIICPYGEIATGDFDKDGKIDLAITSTNGIVTILKNTSSNGVISFASRIDYSLPANATSISAADLNGDGKLDLVLNIRANLEMVILENTSNGGNISFGAPVSLSRVKPTPSSDISLTDFNLDGKIDIGLVAQKLTILLNQSGISRIQLCDSSDTTLSANITGSIYQWQQNTGNGFVDINDNTSFSGSHSILLHIHQIGQSWTNYQYRCLVDNKPSKAFILEIRPLLTPSVSIFASDTSICSGKQVTFSSSVLNVGTPASFQWYINNATVGSNSSSLSLNNLSDNDNVRVIVSTTYSCATSSSVTSNAIAVHVKPTPSANAGTDKTICLGQSASIGTNASGDNYSWSSPGTSFSSNQPVVTVSPASTAAYYLNVTNSFSCTAQDTVIVNVSAPIANAGADKTICKGSTAGTLIGSLTLPNCTYSWSPATGLSLSTVSQPFANPSATTTYILTVVSSPLNCTAKDTVVVTVVQNLSTPTITPSGSTTICQGGSVLLTSSASSGNQWYKDGLIINGIINNTYEATQQGSYTVKYSSSGCTSDFSSPVAVTVTPGISAPVITASGSTTACQGQTVILSSSINSGNQWYKDGVAISGATNQNYNANASGAYAAKIASMNCPSPLSNSISVTITPIPPKPTIAINGNVLTSSASSGNQWYLNGVAIQGATSSSYTATVSGDYSVKVTSGGCESPASLSVTISITAINSPSLSKEIFIAPNPTKDKLKIWYTGSAPYFHVSLVDLSGNRLIKDLRFISTIEIDLTRYPIGVYILTIIGSKGEQTQRLISKL